MSHEAKVLEKIQSEGSTGMKKTDLKREFANNDLNIDDVLENLVSTGRVFIEKKGASYYCWGSGDYIEYLRSTDPKFRLLFEGITTIDKNLESRIIALENSFSDAIKNAVKFSSMGGTVSDSLNIDIFKKEFDNILAKSTNSLGWIELIDVRNQINRKHNISSDRFYHLVEELTNAFHDEYELSTGGKEGVMVRGLVHGYVRGI